MKFEVILSAFGWTWSGCRGSGAPYTARYASLTSVLVISSAMGLS